MKPAAITLTGLLLSLSVGGSAQAPQRTDTARTLAFQKGAVRDDAPGVVKPVILQSVPRPSYTAEALRARVQGSVDVQVVVAPDGSVARQRVARVTWTGEGDESSHFTDTTPGLIANAVTAAKTSTFRPGTLDGAPVAVLTTVTLTFEIH